MSENPKRYWMSPVRSAGDLENASREISTGEVNGDPDFFTTRRSFLKAAGFSFIGAVAASCSRAPAPSAIPYVQQPEHLVPGRPILYASTCDACEARCGLLVTTQGRAAAKDRRQPRSSVVERRDMRRGPGIDSGFI